MREQAAPTRLEVALALPPVAGVDDRGAPAARWSGWSRLRAATRAEPLGAVALLVFGLIVLVTVLGPFLPLPAADEPSLADRLAPPLTVDAAGTRHLLGTDQLGRDVLSRTISGAVVSLSVAVAAVIGAGTVGTLLGLFAGYRAGAADYLLMRLVDVQMAIPSLLLAIFLLYLIGTSLLNLVLLLSIMGWYSYTRLVRAEVLRLRAVPYVEAALVIGCGPWRIMRQHLLPQVVPVLMVVVVLDFSTVMLAEAGISFLGFGVQPPDTSWGRMIAEGQAFVGTGAWWLFAAPGLALFATVLAIRLGSAWIGALLHSRAAAPH